MKIIIVGGDGFCGWPTSLRLAKLGHEVLIVDNLSRRRIDAELQTSSLVPIATIEERIQSARDHVGLINFKILDVAKDYNGLLEIINYESPDAIVHFGEQRAAPYSMIGSMERRYTVDNNISGTHNICSAIVESGKDIQLIHLGTMGVYGYTKEFGKIPEGYLDITINQTGEQASVLYPANPGSIYHMTKCLDQLIFQFYNKNWGLKITDLHQGIVWGTQTKETALDKMLQNRFDYDGIYGTVLNRFISQAANKQPLTVYGTGGQTRAFIHISDTAECIRLAIENPEFDSSKVRIFNQVSEVQNINYLAELVSNIYGIEVKNVENPRNELASNELEVENTALTSLGFEPIQLTNGLIEDIRNLATEFKDNYDLNSVLNSPKW